MNIYYFYFHGSQNFKKMSRFVTLFFFCIQTMIFSFAQSKMIVEPKDKFILDVDYAIAPATLFFKGGNNTTVVNTSANKPAAAQFAVNFSGKLYKVLYLKTAVGINNTDNFMHLNFKVNNGAVTQTILTHYKADYFYLSFLPELRLNDVSQTVSLFINSGFSVYVCNNNRFYNGGYVGAYYNAEILKEFFVNNGVAWESNIGASFRIKQVGLTAGAGYTLLPAKRKALSVSDVPSIGFRQFKPVLGISYYF